MLRGPVTFRIFDKQNYCIWLNTGSSVHFCNDICMENNITTYNTAVNTMIIIVIIYIVHYLVHYLGMFCIMSSLDVLFFACHRPESTTLPPSKVDGLVDAVCDLPCGVYALQQYLPDSKCQCTEEKREQIVDEIIVCCV